MDIAYARRILRLDWIIIEDDSAIIIAQIWEARRFLPLHPYIRGIALLLRGCTELFVHYVYWKANSAVDWIAPMLPIIPVTSSGPRWLMLLFFYDIILSDFLCCIHTRLLV